MTLPTLTELPEAVLDALQVYVGPDAWAYHEDMEGQVDLLKAFLVYDGNVYRVAAAVLRAAAAAQTDSAAGGEAALKRFRVEGKYEEEYFAPGAAAGNRVTRWLALADSLDQTGGSVSAGSFAPSVDPVGYLP